MSSITTFHIITKILSFCGKILTIFYFLLNEVRMLNFAGKNALITGSTRGIGKAISVEFAKLGANVIITGRDRKSAEVLANNIEKEYNAKAFGIDLDLAGDISKSFEEINSFTQGKIDILVNNAGITKDTLFIRMKEEDWNSVINVNLNGTFKVTQQVVKLMIKQRYGRIINISSIIGFIGNIGQANYAATKAGLIGFTKSLAKELASRNITVNAVAPGFIETDMTAELPEDIKAKYLKQIPLNRFGKPEDVANVVLFLASDLASYITGEVIHVNGGMY
jgi:3-oxoacyl-[acyl-carrier protein] reductase